MQVASVAVKQMEQQNNRLKEALVKVRDLLTTEQQGHKDALKELELEKKSSDGLMKERDILKAEFEKCDETIELLKDQIDSNVSSEHMIEILSERNIELEERLLTTQESLDDMESLKEVCYICVCSTLFRTYTLFMNISLDLQQGCINSF